MTPRDLNRVARMSARRSVNRAAFAMGIAIARTPCDDREQSLAGEVLRDVLERGCDPDIAVVYNVPDRWEHVFNRAVARGVRAATKRGRA